MTLTYGQLFFNLFVSGRHIYKKCWNNRRTTILAWELTLLLKRACVWLAAITESRSLEPGRESAKLQYLLHYRPTDHGRGSVWREVLTRLRVATCSQY